MNKFEVVLIFNPELSTTNLKSEIEKLFVYFTKVFIKILFF